MHKISGQRDPAAAFPLPTRRDDASERRLASRAVTVSAAGLAATGITELLVAVLTGSVGLLGDAIHNLSDVSTSAVVFVGFRPSRRGPTERYPYGLDRAEDLAGIVHAHARARWTGRRLRVEIEAWVDPGLTALESDALGRAAAAAIRDQISDVDSFTWATRAAPA
jgi:divalent metal cation (Fe/Co/Zn/Cd) transporter